MELEHTSIEVRIRRKMGAYVSISSFPTLEDSSCAAC